MGGPEIRDCINDQPSKYAQRGDCLYGCHDCKHDICECKESLKCDKILDIGSAFCFVAAFISCCCGALSIWKHTKHSYVFEEEAAQYEAEKMDVAMQQGPCFMIGLFCCCGCF